MLSVNYIYQQNKLLADWEENQKKRSVIQKDDPAKSKKDITIEDVSSFPVILDIPKIDLKVAVVEGTTATALANGPGFIEGTSRPGKRGNIAISGHRTMYGAPFKRLNGLNINDEITLKVPGHELIYETIEIKKVEPTDTSILDDYMDNRITLTTCDPIFSARFRLTVIGILREIRITD